MRNVERGIFKTGIFETGESLKMETSFVVILINELNSALITTFFFKTGNLTMSIDAISFLTPISN